MATEPSDIVDGQVPEGLEGERQLDDEINKLEMAFNNAAHGKQIRSKIEGAWSCIAINESKESMTLSLVKQLDRSFQKVTTAGDLNLQSEVQPFTQQSFAEFGLVPQKKVETNRN